MRLGWLETGLKVQAFERSFRKYKGGWGYPVAGNSCTAALHASMIVAGLQPGDEVITTVLTFCATVNAIVHAGPTPLLADVARKITSRTRAILPVYFAGSACEMDALVEFANRHGLLTIEDCAHALETEYRGRKAGTSGHLGCFSFYWRRTWSGARAV